MGMGRGFKFEWLRFAVCLVLLAGALGLWALWPDRWHWLRVIRWLVLIPYISRGAWGVFIRPTALGLQWLFPRKTRVRLFTQLSPRGATIAWVVAWAVMAATILGLAWPGLIAR